MGAWIAPCDLADPIATRVRLEPLVAGHAGDLLAAADLALFEHGSQAPREWSVKGFEEEIERVRAFPGVAAFAIIGLRGTSRGRAIGRTTFMDIRPEGRAVEIGRTWIGREHHGTGVNAEAKYLMLRHAFERVNPAAIRVQLTANAANAHSIRAITKLGAVREGTLRKARVLPAGLSRSEPLARDWVYFSILEEEWPGVKARLEARIRG